MRGAAPDHHHPTARSSTLSGSRRSFGCRGLRETHAFGAMGVQDFEGVAIGDGDDGASPPHAAKWFLSIFSAPYKSMLMPVTRHLEQPIPR